jgi:hypothetical protein
VQPQQATLKLAVELTAAVAVPAVGAVALLAQEHSEGLAVPV